MIRSDRSGVTGLAIGNGSGVTGLAMGNIGKSQAFLKYFPGHCMKLFIVSVKTVQ